MTQRIITGVLLSAGLIALLYLGGWFFVAGALLALWLCIREQLAALKAAGHEPVWWPSFAALLIAMPMSMYLTSLAIIPVLTAMTLCVLIVVIRREKPELTDVMVSVLPMLSIVLPGMCIFSLVTVPSEFPSRAFQVMLLSMVFTTSVLSDTFAFFIGSRFGGAKLCPAVSPKKTMSGAIGGIFGGIVGAVGMGVFTGLLFPEAPLPPWWANLIIGVVGALASELGDLFFSLVKRHCGVKDFSNLFPGHGGMLDRMDSILFCAIILYCYRAILIATTAM